MFMALSRKEQKRLVMDGKDRPCHGGRVKGLHTKQMLAAQGVARHAVKVFLAEPPHLSTLCQLAFSWAEHHNKPLTRKSSEVLIMDIQLIKQVLVKFLKDQEGMTMVEYAVAGGVITVAGVAAFIALGGTIEFSINRLTARVGS